MLLLLSESVEHIEQFAAATAVKLFYNGEIVATGITVEEQVIHGKELPLAYQKVAVTSVMKKSKLLFKTRLLTMSILM